MKIVFDPDFDGGCWPGPRRGGRASAGEDWVGQSRFVQILETALGLGGPSLSLPDRAARLVPSLRAHEGFWSQSAQVDPFATARRLLLWRDTLTMCGWEGDGKEARLAALGSLTARCAHALPGLPDRLRAVNRALARRSADIESVLMFVSQGELEPLWQRTLHLLRERGTSILQMELRPSAAGIDTDLGAARSGAFHPKGDGSLRLLRPVGPLVAAEEVAAWLASIGDTKDVVIIGGDPALDAALHGHGLPTLGSPYVCCDEAALQILPLTLDLGWTPQDPQRAYELLSLPAGPVPEVIASRLRDALSKWPAVASDIWREAQAEGLNAIENPERRERVRGRLDVLWNATVVRGGPYPVEEMSRRARMLRTWFVARAATHKDTGGWRAAASQCDTFLKLVQHAALTELSAAQLRHLLIEATESAGAASPFTAQAGMHSVGSPGAVAGPARIVVWWRFDEASAPGIARLPLTPSERNELRSLGVTLADGAEIAASNARRWRRPLEQVCEKLLLVCAERDEGGEEVHPHPLWDEIVARVDAKNTRRVAERALLRTTLAGDGIPQTRRTLLPVPTPRSTWSIAAGSIGRRAKESPSSVEKLLECPLQWALQYAGRLYPPESAQVEDGTSARLLGDLLHAIMNRLFEGPTQTAEQAAAEAGAIFDREGPRLVAALFLPGNDAQRERVRKAAVDTARTLYGLMTQGNLKVLATEEARTGEAFGTAFEGRVDLVLGGTPRILDLKWSNANRKREMLKQGTAVQLAAYSFLARDNGHFPPVGYFVMEAQRLLTTEPSAFPGAERVDGPSPQKTWEVVQASHDAAWQEVAEGRIAAPGASDGEPSRPKDPCVVDGRIVMPSSCRYCDYTALCGLAFVEEA